jgi:hypothetical protein
MLNWKTTKHGFWPAMEAELETGLRIVVHVAPHVDKKLAVTCFPTIIANQELEFTDWEEACTEAAVVVREWLDETAKAMGASG